MNLFIIYQFCKSSASLLNQSLLELLTILVALSPSPHELLIECCKESVTRNSCYLSMASNGGVQFTISSSSYSDHDHKNVVDPDAMISFIQDLDSSPSLSGDFFVSLVESHLSLKRNVEDDIDQDVLVLYAAFILELLEKYGDSLLKKTLQILKFCKSCLLDEDDVESIHLGLTLLTQVVNPAPLEDDEEDTHIGFDENCRVLLEEIQMIVSTLCDHDLFSISHLATSIQFQLLKNNYNQPQKDFRESKSALLFRDAIKELGDELLPIRAHGMSVIRGLVMSNDPIATRHLDGIIIIFLDLLHDEDSFIYLNAIKGLSALSEKYPKETLEKLTSRYRNIDFDAEDRLRIGECLLQVIQRMGEAVIKNSAKSICLSILVVMKDKNMKLQASAISLFSQIIKQAPDVATPFLYQLMDFLDGVFNFQVGTETCRGIILLLVFITT